MALFVAVLPLVLAGLLYVWQSANYFFKMQRIGLTIAFIGYTIGNIGFVIDAYEQSGDV
jgi:hypothetical protein